MGNGKYSFKGGRPKFDLTRRPAIIFYHFHEGKRILLFESYYERFKRNKQYKSIHHLRQRFIYRIVDQDVTEEELAFFEDFALEHNGPSQDIKFVKYEPKEFELIEKN